MNPIKLEAVPITDACTYQEVEVASTDWFKFAKKEPGQPGVFEVNAIQVVEDHPAQRRFSYWNGRSFGALSSTPEGAFAERFNYSALIAGITAFRGLTEAA